MPLTPDELQQLREGIEVRDALEIQKAHDMLKSIVLEEIPVGFSPEAEHHRMLLICSLDVLCWVLRHDHNTTFSLNLVAVEQAAEAAGFTLSGPV